MTKMLLASAVLWLALVSYARSEEATPTPSSATPAIQWVFELLKNEGFSPEPDAKLSTAQRQVLRFKYQGIIFLAHGPTDSSLMVFLTLPNLYKPKGDEDRLRALVIANEVQTNTVFAKIMLHKPTDMFYEQADILASDQNDLKARFFKALTMMQIAATRFASQVVLPPSPSGASAVHPNEREVHVLRDARPVFTKTGRENS